MARIEGGCLCGKVRYSADTEPVFVGVCHCTDCQHFTGSAFATVLGLPAPALKVTGTLKTFTKSGDTGKSMHRRFCPECGSGITDEGDVAAGRRDGERRHSRRPELGETAVGNILRQRPAVGTARRGVAALRQDAAPEDIVRPELPRYGYPIADGDRWRYRVEAV